MFKLQTDVTTRPRRGRWTTVMICLMGAACMASSIVKIKWEWPAGRPIETRLLVRIESVQPTSPGLFGIKASPSMADALPDATVVTAVVDEQAVSRAGQKLQVTLPGVKAQKLKSGNWAVFGLIESGIVCTCVAAAPGSTAENARRWLPSSPCNGSVAPSSAADSGQRPGMDRTMESAKRRVPIVKPVEHLGVQLEALKRAREQGFQQSGGVVAALDTASGTTLWTRKLYETKFDANEERDVQ